MDDGTTRQGLTPGIAANAKKRASAGEVLERLRLQKPAMLDTLRAMVEIESPTLVKPAVDAFGDFMAQRLSALGGRVTVHRQVERGNHVQADFGNEERVAHGSHSAGPLLILGHLDTVWDVGALRAMPFRVADGRASGPGALDMKSGLTMALHAIAALQELRGRLPRPVTVLLTSDEEMGSQSSRALIEDLARRCSAALVLEPAAGLSGALKTSRKGVGDYVVKVTGVASHAGLDFDKGHSAIVELARQIEKIAKFVDRKRGITVNPGIVRGGTRTNVVPAEAEVEVDVRIARPQDAAFLDRRFRSLKPFDRRCRLTVSGGIDRPPMERTRQTAALYGIATGVARSLGFRLKEAAVGGGSDGNFTAGLGVPTLDGMGGVGDGAHAAHEFVFIEELPRRAALLAGLIEAI